MYPLGYDFHDTFIELSGFFIAARLSTIDNVYAPDPEKLSIEKKGDAVILTASALIGGGGDIKCGGNLTLRLEKTDDKALLVTASASHISEICRGLALYIRGIDVKSFTSDSANMPNAPYINNEIRTLFYPGRDALMPLVFAEASGGDCFFLSKDKKIRPKAFSAYYDFINNQKVIVLAHQERVPERTNAIQMPPWKIGKVDDRMRIIRERFRDLEENFGLYPFEKRREYTWLKNIKFVLNLHGEHFTGHVFSTFEQMAERLQWVCTKIEGKSILAFIPAWDGRYYTTYPEHKPSPALGGPEGLKKFIGKAHDLGVKVVLMMGGPNLATYKFLKEQDIFECVMRNEWGDYGSLAGRLCWNGDLFFEPVGYIINFGNPRLKEYMVKTVSFIFNEYGADGVFMDGAIRYENTPDYCPAEGMRDFCKEIQAKFPDKLLMGEDGYDVLWSAFGLYATSWQPLGPENSMLRYTRQSMYLAQPDYKGSGGTHEQAWFSEGSKHVIDEKTIPTISITRDIDAEQAEVLEKLIKDYGSRKQIEYNS